MKFESPRLLLRSSKRPPANGVERVAVRHFRSEIKAGLLFVALIWFVYLADCISAYDFRQWGLSPRETSGLFGIVTAPFIHDNFYHLLGNSIPLLVLLGFSAGARPDSRWVVFWIVILSGSLLWLGGRDSIHVGASSLVFGLVAFLIASGFFERRPVAILIALVVGMLYGSSLLFAILPSPDSTISWEGHLFGAVAGTLVAYFYPRRLGGPRS